MLDQLLRLYKKNRTKTPLGDFTTEVFVGLLNMEDGVKESFMTEFLELPKDDDRLKTHMQYSLEDDTNCIVDFVIESESRICFIENKVNSKEGDRQLERYGKVLETFAENDWILHPDTLEAYCKKKPNSQKLLILNYPSNPTGATYNSAQLKAIAKVVDQFGVIII